MHSPTRRRTPLALLAPAVALALLTGLAGPAGAGHAAVPDEPGTDAAAAAWDTDRAAAAYAADPAAVTASGSTGGAPGDAFDGNAGTGWTSDAAADAWIAVDLGAVIRVQRAVLDWDDSAFGKRYAVEVSTDGTNWKPFYTETAGTKDTLTAHTYPQDVTGRYVRMRGIERNAAGYRLNAFQVFGGEPAPAATQRANLALNHPVYANRYQHAGNAPSFATDGGWPADLRGDSTRWASDWHADRWIAVDLGATSTVQSLDLYWEAAYAVDYEVQVSDDNRNWRTVHRPSAQEIEQRRANVKPPGEATGIHDTITLGSPATGRYVRVLGKERRSFYNPAPQTAQFGYSLYEIQVWGTGGSADAAYPALPGEQNGTYQTTFFDDFTGAGLDRGKWRVVRTGQEMGSVNGEAQAYVDSPDNIRTENGVLELEARYCKGCTQAGGGTYDFTSGRIDTYTKHDFTYGKVSARIRVPDGEGFWPAFWLLGSDVDNPDVSWPNSGETDILENIGYPDWTSSGLHGPGYSGGGNIGASQTFPGGGRADQWHDYAVEWTPTAMRFYVDDRLVQETTRNKLESTRGQWVFDHDQYVILNLALGGAYPAGWNKVTEPYWGLPQSSVDKIAGGGVQAEIDWVRVEQKR